jgi:hypothetical protein
VVSSEIILIDGFLDEPHARGLRVAAKVFAWVGGHGGDVMDPKEFGFHKGIKGKLAQLLDVKIAAFISS